MKKHIYKNMSAPVYQKGAALMISLVFFLLISSALVFGAIESFVSDTRTARSSMLSKSAYYLAAAGNEDAVHRIKTARQISNPELLTQNGGTVSIAITNISGTQKQLTASASISSLKRNMETVLATGIGSDFVYGAQVGEGGLVMLNNSRVEGVSGLPGNVYSNGPITGSSGATITGSASVATTVAEDTQAQSTVCNTDNSVGQSSPLIDYAQSFRANSSQPLYKVSLYIKKVGSGTPPSSSIQITADNAGSPSTSSLANASVSTSLVTGSYGWVDITFSSPASLVSGSTYWIVFDAGTNASNYWVWCSDNNNGFSNGVGKYKANWSTGGSWTQITGDLNFKTYYGGGPGILSIVSVGIDARANTVNNSTITGNLYCQSGTGNNKSCNTSQSDPGPLGLPVSEGNITEWKAVAEAGGVITGNCGDSGNPACVIGENQTLSLGPKKITGNLTLSNHKTLNITGSLYVVGSINISNNAEIKCDVSFGSDSCLIIADGSITVDNNGIVNGSGQSGSYILIISTIEGCNGSGGSGCATGSSGISLGNNLTGGIFYTSHSMINLSNNATIKSIVGYKLKLDNNAIIRYEEGVADTNFSAGPGGGWDIRSWKEVE